MCVLRYVYFTICVFYDMCMLWCVHFAVCMFGIDLKSGRDEHEDKSGTYLWCPGSAVGRV